MMAYTLSSTAEPPQSSSSEIQLPIELWGRIFEFVHNCRDRLALCTVSRLFHHEAERVLYNDIDLSYNHLLIMTWFDMIANNSRLACLVRSVTFGFVYAHIPMPTHTWLEIIRNGLGALINLKELHLLKKSNHFIPGDYAWIIRNHTFRLKVFSNDMFDLEPIIPFLVSQPDITVWQQRNATPCKLLDDILLHVSDVTLDPWILLKLISRPVARIRTRIGIKNAAAERQFIHILRSYGQCLSSLELEREVVDESLPIAELIQLLAVKVPLLKCLSIRDLGEMKIDSTAKSLATSLSIFSQLTTVSLFPCRCLDPHSLYMSSLSWDNRVLVSYFFQSSPSLERVELSNGLQKEVWYARSRRHSMIGDIIMAVMP